MYASGGSGAGLGGGNGGGAGDTGTGPATLYTVDPTTAAVTAVGPIGFQLTGLAIDPTTGVLYGSTGSSNTVPGSLITVDKTTGAGTLVGPLANTNDSTTEQAADIAFLPSGQLIGWTENGDNFITIDKSTGATTEVGNDPLSTYGDGMSVDKDGTIFAMLDGNAPAGGALRTIDPATGLSSVVAPLSGTYNDNAAIPAAAFACDGTTLFALDGLQGSTPPDYLTTVNTATGAMTPIAETSVRLNGLEFDCTDVEPSVPTATVAEDAGSVTVTVTRAGGKGAATLQFATADGTAVAGQDYTATSGTLSFADKETTKTIVVPVVGDASDESDETFTVNLTGSSVGAADSSQTVTITDDDVPAAAGTTPPPTVVQNATTTPPPAPPAVVGRKQPKLSHSTTPRLDLKVPFRFVTKGRLTLPAGVSRTRGCSGKVRITFKAGSRTISSRLVSVSKSCTYRSVVRFRIKGRIKPNTRLRVQARFAGNAVLKPALSSVRRVRVS